MSDDELIKILKDRSFISEINGKPKLTSKFTEAYSKGNASMVPSRISSVTVSNTKQLIDTTSLYKQFIREAEVPFRIPTDNGKTFTANAYSADGEKAFIKICKIQGIDLKILLYSTKLYYKDESHYRQTISNYLSKGTWSTFYEEFYKQLNGGKIEDYIKSTLASDSNMEEG